ncbi:pickpocket protein 28-like isoform X2 [Daphnia pulex]|uniref:pickpocket protein 28-like isoform X2 n=1 Tax=Daphnia pulex TaxID=6669 RepID=UPI001EDE41C7|nr:pickpocket protein 28-like isoform X2 [Daphnia pulex]
MTDESAGRRINPFFIHGGGTTTTTTCNHQDFTGDSSDDDPWKTAGMPGMILSRNCSVKANGVPSMTGGAGMVDVNVRQRNAVGIIKWIRKEKKKKKNNKKKTLRYGGGRPTAGAHLRDFMHATSMHGLKYAAEKEATWIERFLWIALFLACFCTAVFFIMRMWSKWVSSPVIISVESTDFPNSMISFPTVSVCNVNQVSNAIVLALIKSKIYREANMSRENLLDLLGGLMRGGVPDSGEDYITQLEDSIHLGDLTSANLTFFMRNVAQPCSQMLLYCEWQSKPVNCSDIFQLVPSNQGFCCVYNLQTVHLNRKRNRAVPAGQQPVKAHGEGVQMGLTVLLDAQIDDYALTSSFFHGFKVLIHHPEDQPDPSTKGFAVSPGSEVFIGVSASSIFSTDDVRLLTPAARNCRYSYENHLNYFSRYSQSNCLMERMARSITRQCGCLPFYFLVGDEATPTCRFKKKSCVQSAFHDFYQKDVNCPVNCNTTSYTADISRGHFPNRDFRASRMARNTKALINDTYLQNNVALLHVFFRDRSGIQYRRDVRYEWQDFVSAVGGLLGLGVGFSLLSLMEILYFCGLRSCLRRNRAIPAPAPFHPFNHIEFDINKRLARHIRLNM